MTLEEERPPGAVDGTIPSVTVGARLREARLARRKTIVEIASACGLTKGYLSKLERDQASPSIASLLRLCAVLEVPLASLFEPSTGELIRKRERQQISAGGDRMREFLLTSGSERRMQVIFGEVEPGGGSGDELYLVEADVEFVFVTAGRLVIRLEEREVTLEEGDAYTFAVQSRHAFYNPDESTVTNVLWVLVPALS